MAAGGPRHEPRGEGVTLPGTLRAKDVPAVMEAIRRSGPPSRGRTVTCDATPIVDPDVCTVDALARLALEVRRVGLRLVLRHAPSELRELLELAGLTGVLPCAPSGIEPIGQAEAGKEPGRIEEERDARDPTA